MRERGDSQKWGEWGQVLRGQLRQQEEKQREEGERIFIRRVLAGCFKWGEGLFPLSGGLELGRVRLQVVSFIEKQERKVVRQETGEKRAKRRGRAFQLGEGNEERGEKAVLGDKKFSLEQKEDWSKERARAKKVEAKEQKSERSWEVLAGFGEERRVLSEVCSSWLVYKSSVFGFPFCLYDFVHKHV